MEGQRRVGGARALADVGAPALPSDGDHVCYDNLVANDSMANNMAMLRASHVAQPDVVAAKGCRRINSTSEASNAHVETTTRCVHSAAACLYSDLKYSEDLFNYTRGRFVCNEQYEMSQRHVRFNVNELARCAADAVGAKSCVSVSKYPDGMYNKSMLLTMDDGSRVVAKVPNPNAGLPHFTTASEVATMEFARNVLGNPVPKVLAWSSQAHESPVGAEYIIMERVAGVELGHVWPEMAIKERFDVVKAIAGFQKSWTSISFAKYGSLYFRSDLNDVPDGQPLYVDADGNHVKNTRYAIGPLTGREYFDNGRGTVDFDRGPWTTLEAYHTAIGQREISCVERLPELPKSPVTLCGPGTYQPTRANKLKALRYYLNITRQLLPTDTRISSAHLWHTDLHPENIFVNPSDPTKVVGLIDWQSTEVSPLYFHARHPHLLDYAGSPMNRLERPQWKALDGLDPAARQQAETLYLQQSLASLYNTLTHHKNPRLYDALQFQNTDAYFLLLVARNLLVDGEVPYLSQLAELEQTWNEISGDGSSSPFTFSEEEREELDADMEGVALGMQAMRQIRDSLGELFPEQGIVKHERQTALFLPYISSETACKLTVNLMFRLLFQNIM
ncbi:hypothetical protein OPT61_g10596 [Boeremia exigua]|uniref:Uncharacterized protein n=1 Tax=Boeremia exigua TaxID=749465 RepID=A0ACC2HNY5_9PLEO|nr:hypothetical protein OPT61_g10596 [Boeremia exigua]